MNTSAMQKIFTFSRKAREISGNDSRNSSQSKNAALTSAQPGACVTTTTSDREEDDRAEQRDGDGASGAAAARGSESRGCVQRAYFRTGAPVAFASQVCWMPLQRAVRLQRRERLVHAADERVALLEDHPEALLRSLRRELAEDLAVRHLHRGDVERGRQVDDEPVDLAVLQRRDRGVVRVVDGRRWRRLDSRR